MPISPTTGADQKTPRRFRPKFHIRVLGSAAPVFPGFEVDILDRVPDDEKPEAVWHRDRARAILRAHPEVRKLFGHSPSTSLFCLMCSGAQVALAATSAHVPLWAVISLAWVFGSMLNVCLFQLAHECNHNLIFKKTFANRVMFTLTSLPMFLSAHHTWWAEHLSHHSDMGAKKDFITRRRTFFLTSRILSPMFFPYSLLMIVTQIFRSLIGVVVYVTIDLVRGRVKPSDRTLAILADQHLVSGYRRDGIESWAVIYPVLNFIMCGLLFWYGFASSGLSGSSAVWAGLKPLLYLMAAQAFMTGFMHPLMLGIVLGISHFHGTRRYQPSASNYNRLINWLTFNAGLHVEHHDIAGIPWHRLWKLRRIAREFYDDLETIPSYTLLGLKFVFCSPTKFAEEFDNETQRNIRRFMAEAAEAN
ncbi:MAG TPA: fatty acid desaturase [Pirellulales bacterium]